MKVPALIEAADERLAHVRPMQAPRGAHRRLVTDRQHVGGAVDSHTPVDASATCIMCFAKSHAGCVMC